MSKQFDQEVIGASENTGEPSPPFPSTLLLTPLSRRPIKLPDETVRTVMGRSVPALLAASDAASTEIEANRVSIVIITFNNLLFTRLCLESLLANSEYSNYEIVIVDNSSTDGTTDYLRAMAQHYANIQAIFNDTNRGFAAANNQGLALADGDVLILLNNDTIVPPGWLSRLVQHLEDTAIGLLGPVTNRIGNEAEIEANYRTYGEFVQFAQEYTRQHEGELFDIPTLCMYCLAMRRDVYEQLGPLDERFEIGMLEDDDYSMRAHAANFRVVCAEDVFVHHFGGASFGNLVPTGEYGELLEANRRRFEEKWGVPWQPYGRRLSREYLRLHDRIRDIVHDLLPPDAVVLVVSKGDDELLRLNGREARHFPQNADGTYAGCYPANSTEAIDHLEELRQREANFLLLPSTAFWWLDHYEDFHRHLDSSYQRIWSDECCIIYQLHKHA